MRQNPGYWRAPPYFQSRLSSSTVDVLKAKDALAGHTFACLDRESQQVQSAHERGTNADIHMKGKSVGAESDLLVKRGLPNDASAAREHLVELSNVNSTGPTKCSEYTVSSSESLIQQRHGKAQIFRCPGGKEACPGIQCGEGYMAHFPTA